MTLTTRDSPRLGIRKVIRIWMRRLHLYAGMFIAPYLVVFGVTTMFLNHGWRPQPTVESRSEPIAVHLDPNLDPVSQVWFVLEQLPLTGEVNIGVGFSRDSVMRFAVLKPGHRSAVGIDLRASTVTVEHRDMGLVDRLAFLHVAPGPHRVRGANWVFTRVWGGMSDLVVYMLVFVTASGIYLWLLIRAERKTGLATLGLGTASFAAIVFALLYA